VAHLMAMGIDPITVVKGMRSKFLEVTQYTKNIEQIQSLKVDLAGAFDNKVRQKNLKAQIQALEDAKLIVHSAIGMMSSYSR
jgi:hypothetical protein